MKAFCTQTETDDNISRTHQPKRQSDSHDAIERDEPNDAKMESNV